MYGTTAREKWEFPMAVAELRVAVDAKAAHHRERAAWWQTQLNAAQDDLKENGVSFRSYDHSGGRGIEPVVDHTISRRVSECKHKVAEHTKQLREYEAFAFGLARKGDGELLPMTPDDLVWAGFVLSNADDEDEEV